MAYYNIISKIKKIAKNSKIVRRSKISTSQVSDIILDACMKFQNYPIKTVGGDAFYSHYILYLYLKFQKIAKKKSKIVRWSK